jgi:tRNA(Ile)-lysidine synthase
VVLSVGYRTIVIADASFKMPSKLPDLDARPLPLCVPGTTALPGDGVVETMILAPDALCAGWSHNADPWRAYMDADAVGAGLSLRRRRAGDRFCPLGMGGRHKLVNELLIDAKVPAEWRDRVPLLVREDGEIMWVCGWRVDERARVTEKTSRVIQVHVRLREQRD